MLLDLSPTDHPSFFTILSSVSTRPTLKAMLTLPYLLLNTTFTPMSVWCVTYWVITRSFQHIYIFPESASYSVSTDRVFVNSGFTLLDSGPHLHFPGSKEKNSVLTGLPTTLFILLDLLEKSLAFPSHQLRPF